VSSLGWLCTLCGLTAWPAAAQSGVDPDPVMAAFVHRFAQFVEWPDAVVAGSDDVRICVAGSRELLEQLQGIVAGEDLGGRPIVATEARSPADVPGCHILFVSYLSTRSADFVAAARGLPVLTVGDPSGFLDSGGIIHLRIIDRRIRFAIDAAAASEVGLRLSSQLLDLAVEVRRGGE
jgi:hypothetical protein